MNIAVAVFREFVAPRFDCCSNLLVEEQRGDENVIRWIGMDRIPRCRRIRVIKNESIKVLLCGGICRRDLFELQTSGIHVIPFLKGKYADVLRAFHDGEIKLCRDHDDFDEIGNIQKNSSNFEFNSEKVMLKRKRTGKGLKNDNHCGKWERWDR